MKLCWRWTQQNHTNRKHTSTLDWFLGGRRKHINFWKGKQFASDCSCDPFVSTDFFNEISSQTQDPNDGVANWHFEHTARNDEWMGIHHYVSTVEIDLFRRTCSEHPSFSLFALIGNKRNARVSRATVDSFAEDNEHSPPFFHLYFVIPFIPSSTLTHSLTHGEHSS